MTVRKLLVSTASTWALLFCAPVVAQDGPKNAYFGELHLHTKYSLDAYGSGNTLNDPFAAYRFARGEEVDMPVWGRKRIVAPLDFAAVTDHAEELGEYETCTNSDSLTYSSEACVDVRNFKKKTFDRIFEGPAKGRRLVDICGRAGAICTKRSSGPWGRIQQAASEAYKPGEFTTFVAYEYTAEAREGAKLHRNVIFRTKTVPKTVFSAYDGTGEALQAWLERTCTGDCQALTIPHNPNLSWGRFYWDRNSDGSAWTKEQIERRARYDRLVEIIQLKGNSECQTGFHNTDEECDFEIVPPKCKPGQGCNTELSFVRTGLKLGLKHEEEWGTNPFKHGFVGATDDHNGLPSDTSESDYRGHYANDDFDPRARLGLPSSAYTKPKLKDSKFYNPGAITGVWAAENTRESIWDALHRKETFATSGTRVKARLIGGFDLSPETSDRPRLGAQRRRGRGAAGWRFERRARHSAANFRGPCDTRP